MINERKTFFFLFFNSSNRRHCFLSRVWTWPLRVLVLVVSNSRWSVQWPGCGYTPQLGTVVFPCGGHCARIDRRSREERPFTTKVEKEIAAGFTRLTFFFSLSHSCTKCELASPLWPNHDQESQSRKHTQALRVMPWATARRLGNWPTTTIRSPRGSVSRSARAFRTSLVPGLTLRLVQRPELRVSYMYMYFAVNEFRVDEWRTCRVPPGGDNIQRGSLQRTPTLLLIHRFPIFIDYTTELSEILMKNYSLKST